MIRSLFAACLLASLPGVASAHMVYVVPAKDCKSAAVVFSDTLDPT